MTDKPVPASETGGDAFRARTPRVVDTTHSYVVHHEIFRAAPSMPVTGTEDDRVIMDTPNDDLPTRVEQFLADRGDIAS